MHHLTLLMITLCAGCLCAEKPTVHFDPEKMGDIFQSIMHCLGEAPVDPEILLQLRSGKAPSEKGDKNLAKFIHCAFVKTGYGKKNGHVKIDKTLELYPKSVDKEALRKAMEECDKDGKTPEETAFNFFKCFREKTPVKVVL